MWRFALLVALATLAAVPLASAQVRPCFFRLLSAAVAVWFL